MATTINNTTTIHHVYGNVLKLAIPLTLRTITLEGGVVHAQDTDYYPSTHDLVMIEFSSNGPIKHKFTATLRDGHIAVMEDKGTIPVGTYAITVLCHDENGDPRRFKQRTVLDVVDVTADAGIEAGIEFEGGEWYLDAAIFLAVVGENGVGIADITTHETDVSGEYNSVTFTLTNGESYTLFVRNGLSTEQTLPANIVIDEFYVHTDNNYTDADQTKVQQIDTIANNAFGRVVFDPISKYINFFAKGDTSQTRRLGYVDASPFLVDANLNSVSVNNNGEMVFQFNQDSNKEPIRLPISLIFNKDNYYTKTEANALINNKADKPVEVTFTTGNQNNISCSHTVANIYQNYQNHKQIVGKFGESVGTLVYIKGGENQEAAFLFGDRYDSPYLLRNAGTQYWSKEDLVDDSSSIEIDGGPIEDSENAVSSGGVWYALTQKVSSVTINGTTQTPDEDGDVSFTVEGGSGGYEPPVGGIPKTDLASGVQSSLDAADSAYQKPSGGIPSTDMTSAVQTSLGKADTAYQKPSGGIPASDLASGVQTSLGKADTALQSQEQADWNESNSSDPAYIKNKPTIPAAQVQTDWNASSGMGVILNKPTIPTVDATLGTSSQSNAVQGGAIVEALAGKENTLTWDSAPTSSSTNPVTSGGIYTALQGKQDTISNLATITTNAGKGLADVSSEEDGTVVFTLANEDTYTLDLNHEHPQYLETADIDDYVTAGTNVTITKDSQTGVLEISASGGSSGVTGITMNGSDVTISNGVAALGTVITSLSGCVQSNATTGVTNIVVCTDEAAYTAITTKDSNTLYLIKESNA